MSPFLLAIRHLLRRIKLSTKGQRTKHSDINQLSQHLKKDIGWDNELIIRRFDHQRPIVVRDIVFRFDR